MLSRFSEVLQSAADVLAPPASRVEDFEYHWKLILHYYNSDHDKKIHVEDTKIPLHLHQMLQLLVDEETEQPDSLGPCLEKLISKELRLLDCLTVISSADYPAGARSMVLSWCTSLLRRVKQPFINHTPIYQPIQRILIQCNENPASPTEKEEVELLLTLCGLVRKQPGLANIFTTPFLEDKQNLLNVPDELLNVLPLRSKVKSPCHNPLFEVTADSIKSVALVQCSGSEDESGAVSNANDETTSCRSQKTIYDDNDKFLLIDLLLTYLNSADNHIVLRACEGIMIISSLPDDDIANLVTSCSSVCETLIEKLVVKYKAIPINIDPCDVDQLNISWGYVVRDFGDRYINKFPGYRELTAFLSWLDYCDTLMKECHCYISTHLARTFRQNFLENAVEVGLNDVHHTLVVTALITKCLKVIDSSEFINEISNWLVGDGEIPEWPLLHTMINNCLSQNQELSLEALRFFEAILEKPTEHSLQRLVLCQLSNRCYLINDPNKQQTIPDEDERDRLNDVSLWRERDSNREAMAQLLHEGQVSDHIADIITQESPQYTHTSMNIHKVINSYLLLLPKAILSDPVGDDYVQYIHDAQRQYQLWLDITSSFRWPMDHSWTDNTSNSAHSCDSRPEADIHMDKTSKKHPYEHNDVSQMLTRKLSRDYSRFPSKTQQSESSKSLEICCPIDDNSDVIGKCGKPASQCPFKQNLVLRNRDLHKENDMPNNFNEGPFLKMLFDLLQSMPVLPYQINLQLTIILSKLAMLPHPYLHEYLLNPMLPLAKGTRSLFRVLQGVAKTLTSEIPRYKNYKKIVEYTRTQLMGDDPSYDESENHNQLFECLVVLEEFCKELAAISFVKYQNGVTFTEFSYS